MSISELEEKRKERLLSVRREIPPLGLGTWQMPDDGPGPSLTGSNSTLTR